MADRLCWKRLREPETTKATKGLWSAARGSHRASVLRTTGEGPSAAGNTLKGTAFVGDFSRQMRLSEEDSCTPIVIMRPHRSPFS